MKKMNLLKRTAAVVLTLVLLLAPAAPAFAQENRTVKAGFFKYPGYHEIKDGAPGGYGYDFLTLLRRYTSLNFELTGYENSWEEMQQMLLSGEIDMVTSARKTREREELFDFSEPIGTNSARLTARIGDERFIPGYFQALDGITIGELAGNSRNADLEAFAEEKGFSYKVRTYPTEDKLSRALWESEVDAIVASSLRKTQGEKTIAEFAPQDFYVIVRKGDSELLREINYGISQMDMYEGNWRDDLFYSNYEEGKQGELTFTKRERDYIRDVQHGKKQIVATANPDRDPYSFTDENGNLTGIIPDYFGHLMKMAGLPYTTVASSGNAEFEKWTAEGYPDVVMDCRLGTSPSAETDFGIVTEPFIKVTVSRVTRKGFNGTVGTIAAVDTQEAEFVEEDLAGDPDILTVGSRTEAMKAVNDGRADVCYVYTYMAEKYIGTDPDAQLVSTVLESPVYDEYIYVSSGADHELASILNKCVRADAAGNLDEYVRSYMNVSYENVSFIQYLKLHPAVLIMTVGALFALAVLAGVAEVRSRMNALKREQLEKELRRLDQIKGLAGQFSVLYFVDLDTEETENYYLDEVTPDEARDIDRKAENFFEAFKNSMVVYAHPDFRADLMKFSDPEYVRSVLENDRRYDFRFLCMNAEGGYSWTDMTIMRLSDSEDGRPLKVAVGYSNTDAEMKERLEAEKKTRMDLEAIKGLADEYDTLQFIDLGSDSFSQYFITEDSPDRAREMADEIRSFSEFFRESMNAFCHPDDLPEMMKFADTGYIKEILSGQVKYTRRFLCNSDSGYKWCEFALIRLDREEEPTRAAVGYTNIDEAVREEMRQKKELTDALETANRETMRNDLIIGTLNAGKWSYEVSSGDEITAAYYSDSIYSSAMIRSTGKPMGWADRLHPEDRERALGEFMAAVRDHSCETKYDTVFRIIGEDGKSRYFRSAGNIIRRYDGTGEFFGLSIDMTEQIETEKKEREELEKALSMAQSANRAKTTFLNNMSHDIRTPMNAIIGFTGLAERHIDDREQVRDYLGKIAQSSDHLLNLINDVLDMSRIESGKITLDEKPENVADMISSIQSMIQADIENRHLCFTLDSTDVASRSVVCDRLRLNQVLLNILSNSIKYTAAGGKIAMRVTEKECGRDGYSTFVFRVRDNGIGMSKEFLKTIFEPFTRAKSSTVSGIQGTGLGMAITKNIVDMMGGTIDVDSTPGMGTTVTVTVDMKLGAAQKPRDEKPEGVYDFRGKKILLVEDNELNREIATDILTEEGFVLDTAEDGDIAVAKIKDAEPGDYDLILMDIQMPRMNGYEATMAIRALGTEISKIPIIAMTANAFEEDKKLAFEAGMNEHIAKPIDIARLKETLAKFTGTEK